MPAAGPKGLVGGASPRLGGGTTNKSHNRRRASTSTTSPSTPATDAAELHPELRVGLLFTGTDRETQGHRSHGAWRENDK